MNPHYAAVAERAGHRCEYCHAPESIFNLPFEVEHIIPSSRDGPDEEANLALACRACNLYKGGHLTGLDERTQTSASLFHPRQDEWETHFRVNIETGVIEGLTASGRATLARLQMNAPGQLLARILWMRLGLFP
jgi:hypothetical protein